MVGRGLKGIEGKKRNKINKKEHEAIAEKHYMEYLLFLHNVQRELPMENVWKNRGIK